MLYGDGTKLFTASASSHHRGVCWIEQFSLLLVLPLSAIIHLQKAVEAAMNIVNGLILLCPVGYNIILFSLDQDIHSTLYAQPVVTCASLTVHAGVSKTLYSSTLTEGPLDLSTSQPMKPPSPQRTMLAVRDFQWPHIPTPL